MIDVTLQPFQVGLEVPSEEQLAEGANALRANFTIGAVLPITMGPGQPPIPVPLGQLHIPLNREQAISLGESLIKEAERLPKESNIITANNIGEVDQMARFTEGLRGN